MKVPSCWLAGVLAGLLLSHPATAQGPQGPLVAIDASIVAAEAALRDGEVQIAESRYRTALMQGWMLVGRIDAGEAKFDAAKMAFDRASRSTVQPREALQSLSLVHLQESNPAPAIDVLTKLVARDAKDISSRRLLAQALAAAGQRGEAVQELEEANAIAPDDPELQFALASGYLRVGKVEAADRLFSLIAQARPIPETYVLIGRTYRDAGQHARARTALRQAVALDPKVHRAHYYLGTVALLEQGALEEGIAGLDEAIVEFQAELKVSPDDPLTTLRLGMAFVLAQRPAEALPFLERAARREPPLADAFLYLGRAQLALDRPAEAVESLQRALALSDGKPRTETQLGTFRSLHYQLGLALRRAGRAEEAAVQFQEAERAAEKVATVARNDLAKYLADAPDPAAINARPPLESVFPFASMPPGERAVLRQEAISRMARAYFNLGVMHVQAQRFGRAAEMFEEAARLDPAFPNVQYSLGVAYFNAKNYAKAVPPLERAFAATPGNGATRRMLALASLNSEQHARAAELLKDDPNLWSEPSLQFAYGMALVRSGRAELAEAVFGQLLALHGETPELNVMLGQANAQQGDYDAAIASFNKAIAAKPEVADANAALGYIYMKQGRLEEAAGALRAELAHHPGDVNARQTLATVLELQNEPDQAITELRIVLRTAPGFANARYLLGKILLAQGNPQEAVEHLNAAVKLAPEDANIHYQLGQAYRRLGNAELSQQYFQSYQALKDKQGGRTP